MDVDNSPFARLCHVLLTMRHAQENGNTAWRGLLPEVWPLIDQITDPGEQQHIRTLMAGWRRSQQAARQVLQAERVLIEAQLPGEHAWKEGTGFKQLEAWLVCSHPERERLEHLLQAGGSVRRVAQQFGLGYSSVHRHKHHGPGAVVTGGRCAQDWTALAAEAAQLQAQAAGLRGGDFGQQIAVIRGLAGILARLTSVPGGDGQGP
jgi:hypothetical protein